jgi:hypothetical protein
MDRHTVDSLLVKEETIRDGAALSQQLTTDVFSVSLFIIALASVSFGMYALVLRRRLFAPESEEELADQTDVVAAQMDANKSVPELVPAVPPAPGTPPAPMPAVPPQPVVTPALDRSQPPPLPPTGLPEGWSDEQWASYGWQYIDALRK